MSKLSKGLVFLAAALVSVSLSAAPTMSTTSSNNGAAVQTQTAKVSKTKKAKKAKKAKHHKKACKNKMKANTAKK